MGVDVAMTVIFLSGTELSSAPFATQP
jgi:hypothetical protein